MTEVFEVGRVVGSYRIIRPLGSGGMGVVYEVEHLKLKTRRALKVFAAENENAELHRKRFLIEGKMLSALDHQRVVRVHEFEVDPATSRPYFVMDLVLSPDGTPRTLEDERRSGVDEEKCAKWFSDICEGLDYVHSLGIVHRDVKLENILIGPDGRAVLSDFGISRIFDDALRERLDITVTMPQDDRVLRVLGSAYYVAPELLGSEPPKATPASDAWALGVMMFRLLSGIWFERESRANCLDVLTDCDLPWRALVDRLCAEDPAARRPAKGFTSLAAALTSASIRAEASAPPLPKRRGWLWGAVAALAVAAGVVGYFAFSPVPPPVVDYAPIEPEPEEKASAPVIETVQIPTSVQTAVLKAERDCIRRQFYDPVAKALEGESETNRVAWAGVLQTAEDMLHYVSGGVLQSWREYLGRGAEEAWKKGCDYPVPVAYAYGSLVKRKQCIQDAYGRVYDALETDTRWNPASRIVFYGFMMIDENAPMTITDLAEKLSREMESYLTTQAFASNELGVAYHTLAFNNKSNALERALVRVTESGTKLDPWLRVMLEGEVAHRKAWDARGFSYANTVTDEGWEIYRHEIAKVLPLAEKAYRLRPDLPQSALLALKTCYGDAETADRWLRRLKACRYDFLAGYAQYLWGLRPRWNGSTERMTDFLLDLAREAHFDTMVPIFAYERLVKDVFRSEGGVKVTVRHFSTVDQFIESERDVFEQYFKGYRESGLRENAAYLERVHIAVALADLAWRLGNAEELLYWADEVEKLGMPVHETEFDFGYRKYKPYLRVLKKLAGYKMNVFMAGLHAGETDGDPAAIDAMIEIAREVGEMEAVRDCVLSRRGRSDLTPFLSGNRFWDFTPYARDHLIFRISVSHNGGASATATSFEISATTHGINPKTNRLDTQNIKIEVKPGIAVVQDQPVWDSADKTCSYELEIVGDVVRLTQGGRRIWERRLAARPSQLKYFSVFTRTASGHKFEKIEWEVRDDMTFAIPSEERPRRLNFFEQISFFGETFSRKIRLSV